jgi:hypothetical protein
MIVQVKSMCAVCFGTPLDYKKRNACNQCYCHQSAKQSQQYDMRLCSAATASRSGLIAFQ